jgi:hypothetical protein
MSELPPGVARRLTPGVAIDLDDPAGRSAVIGLLLEDGDRNELAWLASTFERGELHRWFVRHGGRRLSRRSRAFWSATFDLPAPKAPWIAREIWPLA